VESKAGTVRGIGTDVVSVARIHRAVDRTTGRILLRLFTSEERDYCRSKRAVWACYAARFAAKEAVLKALGTGLSGFGWQDVEVRNCSSGRPQVVLSGGAAREAEKQGITEIMLSISHEREYAVAFAVALGSL